MPKRPRKSSYRPRSSRCASSADSCRDCSASTRRKASSKRFAALSIGGDAVVAGASVTALSARLGGSGAMLWLNPLAAFHPCQAAVRRSATSPPRTAASYRPYCPFAANQSPSPSSGCCRNQWLTSMPANCRSRRRGSDQPTPRVGNGRPSAKSELRRDVFIHASVGTNTSAMRRRNTSKSADACVVSNVPIGRRAAKTSSARCVSQRRATSRSLPSVPIDVIRAAMPPRRSCATARQVK